jgi:hypothetical protein
MQAILKAAEGKKLTQARINELFEKFRAGPRKWRNRVAGK